jgi:hypothetical protein
MYFVVIYFELQLINRLKAREQAAACERRLFTKGKGKKSLHLREEKFKSAREVRSHFVGGVQ